MTSDVAARMYEHISALGRAEAPDIERIEHLFKRASRLVSLRRQVERLEDELELELFSSGDHSDRVELDHGTDDGAARPSMRTHVQPPRALRCHRP
jgi:hypothetical protein